MSMHSSIMVGSMTRESSKVPSEAYASTVPLLNPLPQALPPPPFMVATAESLQDRQLGHVFGRWMNTYQRKAIVCVSRCRDGKESEDGGADRHLC